MPGDQESGVNHAPPGKLPEIMRPPWPPSRKMVLGTPLPGENSLKVLFFKSNPIVAGMIAQLSLTK